MGGRDRISKEKNNQGYRVLYVSICSVMLAISVVRSRPRSAFEARRRYSSIIIQNTVNLNSVKVTRRTLNDRARAS